MGLVSLHGAYFPNNYGDVLILAIQANWIREINNNEVALPFATDIYRTTIKASELKGKESIQKSDFLVYGAGGYLGEPPKGNLKWSLNFLRNHLKPALIAKSSKVPYQINGTGAGPLSNIVTRNALTYIANNADSIIVRDTESQEYIGNFSKKNKLIHSSADVALSLTKKDLDSKIVDYVKEKYLNFSGIKIGIHAGADRFDTVHGSNVQIFMDETIEFFNSHLDLTPVILIDNDNDIQNEATKYLNENLKNNTVVYKHNDIWETTAILSELDSVITNKLHIGIVNYAMGNVPISFPYHSKTKRFYRQIGLNKLCIPIDQIERKIVLERISQVYNDIVKGDLSKYQAKREELLIKSLENKKALQAFLKEN